ncbi:MAG: STAS domain-containing protein [Spirochaetales bacterium]|nr:STAS domain-containing protein [Spirochaetales bacterium]
MEIREREAGPVTILDVSGEMSLYHTATLKGAFTRLESNRKLDTVLNLDGVNYLDSSGIGVLIAHLTRCRKEGGSLKLCNLQPNVSTLLKLTKLNNLFEIYETESEALESYQN